MQNISRRKKQSLTRKKAKIEIGQSWPRYLITILFTGILCAVLFYKIFDGGNVIGFLSRISELESLKQGLDKVILEKNLATKIRDISYDKLAEELKATKEENIKLKEDVMFYESIVGKRQK